ncbi:unnamed protein product [Microthlaspi erraticum]|uniref:Uncharacterized protein n=1 Tax=Microthlaspi erraticum TaxID=1685480 RepID=A0A6D2KJ59_9BRAS|nr:unnamed protein product [Microthlaspi erraticum]
MDFIKTSSLRALIELTFQRNWNGLIWMSRKGVTTKRVKTVQTALSRISAQPRSPAGRGTNVRARPNLVRPSEVSAKVQTVGRSRNHDPGNIARGRPRHRHDRARPKRASRENASRPRNLLAYHGRCIRPSREDYVPRPAEISSAKFIRPTTAGRPRIRPTPTVPTRPQPDCPADRPARPSQRRGRPEALFEAQTYVFKPGLTLAASRKT